MKLHCTNPKHDDQNASMEVYSDSAYCFVCGWVDWDIEDKNAKKKPPTDISKALEYINELPIRKYRGLDFPTDDTGYYIIWPESPYYKKRLFEGNIRYTGPRGSKIPLFSYLENSNTLILVEGEINCITLRTALPELRISIASPGAATNLMNYLTEYSKYDKVVIVVDKDKPGVINGLKTKEALLKRGKKVNLIALDHDFNEMYEKEGWEAIRVWWKENVGL